MWNELSNAPEYDMDYLMWDRRRKDSRESPIFPSEAVQGRVQQMIKDLLSI